MKWAQVLWKGNHLNWLHDKTNIILKEEEEQQQQQQWWSQKDEQWLK